MKQKKFKGIVRRLANQYRKNKKGICKIDVELDEFKYIESIERNKEYYSNRFSVEILEDTIIELTGRINSSKYRIDDLNEEFNFSISESVLLISAIVGYIIGAVINYGLNQESISLFNVISSGILGLLSGVGIFIFIYPLLDSRSKTSEEIKKLRYELQELEIQQKIIEIEISRVTRK
ncbi:hypothetical protein [Acetobacterium wieringae]|uniref:hypothetical protein n=1 Tax=Acetobacterium wieringae TaxID=52694 RepID=UPI002033CDC8|nr:hypothetical protein [Acetobacterium wieringae]URN83497.1 hypothetical protein CHL1_002636 [Acetobacterium wieringae]